MKKILIILFLYPVIATAQVPQPAFNPMTAPGAFGITSGHLLYWQNPSNVQYNECYFSTDSVLVANQNPSVRIQNGYPSTVYESVALASITDNTKYFWKVVEYNASGNSSSPVWYFKSQPFPSFLIEYEFSSDFESWEILGPMGFDNWYWWNTSSAGGYPGEIVFRWDPVFIGDSYIMSPEIPCPAGAALGISFRYYEDWWSDTVVVGCAITQDNGITWNSLWELHAGGNVGPDIYGTEVSAPGNFRIGFYYTGDSNNIDFFFADQVTLFTPITVAYPPSFLQANASSTEQKVILNWNPGSTPSPPITGYRLQRKQGLPTDNSPYFTVVETGPSTYTFYDESVDLNNNYTYRIATISGSGNVSHYGNEATAYVPAIVPVELQRFDAEVTENKVNLTWSTETETNNSGFEILRSVQNDNTWVNIGFVPGFGTSTEVHHYSFMDESLQSGDYQYRLKQIDFDGTFEYSNILEVTVDAPTIFSLEQNYPNPFNPTTKIKYSIADVIANPDEIRMKQSQFITLKIYDVLGNEVATLVNEQKPAGTYEVEFNGTGLPSGIYFYQLLVSALQSKDGKAGTFIESKKMVLLK
jgi:hypothetical protein